MRIYIQTRPVSGSSSAARDGSASSCVPSTSSSSSLPHSKPSTPRSVYVARVRQGGGGEGGGGGGGGGNELGSILEAEEEACGEQEDKGGEANGNDSNPVMRVAQVVLEGGGDGGDGGEGREGETRSKEAAHAQRKGRGGGAGVLRSWLPLSGWRRRRVWEAPSGGGDSTGDSGSTHTQEDHGHFPSVDSTETVSRISGLNSASASSPLDSTSALHSTLASTSGSVVGSTFPSLLSAQATSLVSDQAGSPTHALSTPGVRGQERLVVGGAKFGRSEGVSSIQSPPSDGGDWEIGEKSGAQTQGRRYAREAGDREQEANEHAEGGDEETRKGRRKGKGGVGGLPKVYTGVIAKALGKAFRGRGGGGGGEREAHSTENADMLATDMLAKVDTREMLLKGEAAAGGGDPKSSLLTRVGEGEGPGTYYHDLPVGGRGNKQGGMQRGRGGWGGWGWWGGATMRRQINEMELGGEGEFGEGEFGGGGGREGVARIDGSQASVLRKVFLGCRV